MSLFHRKKLQVAWQYTSPGVLWRLHATNLGVMVGEERNIEKRAVSFFSINLFNGNVAWKSASFGDAWWTGVEAVEEDVLFLHGFATPDMPEHLGVIAVDLVTGTKLWERSDLKFLLAKGGVLLAVKKEIAGEEVFELDRRTGDVLKSLGDDPRSIRRSRQLSSSGIDDEIELPAPLGDVAGEGSDQEHAIRQHCGTDADSAVEAISHGAWVVFNYHRRVRGAIPEQARVASILSIMDKAGKDLVYTDTLVAGQASMMPDSYFIHRDMLVYVKEQKHLVAVRLTHSSTS